MPMIPKDKWDARVYIFTQEVARNPRGFLKWLDANHPATMVDVVAWLDAKWDAYASNPDYEVPPLMADVVDEGTLEEVEVP